jgi:hypothetical protein
MPPFIWAIGAVGAALVAKLLADVGRKERELEEQKKRATTDERADLPKLERDPETGEYRPPRG